MNAVHPIREAYMSTAEAGQRVRSLLMAIEHATDGRESAPAVRVTP